MEKRARAHAVYHDVCSSCTSCFRRFVQPSWVRVPQQAATSSPCIQRNALSSAHEHAGAVTIRAVKRRAGRLKLHQDCALDSVKHESIGLHVAVSTLRAYILVSRAKAVHLNTSIYGLKQDSRGLRCTSMIAALMYCCRVIDYAERKETISNRS
jgi:hypothetical protein